ncbi:pimeloyl-ACP methyl ester carboxylesterase [Natronospira proteinivora]|uniref:Pimeloyl-ACP methyl ester carboxylesterase n=1 Tax=Natronospira proteinivora TaxID=1807133 RepID=A0ABT1G7K0_9GAMM|nr:alpha/beta hydrolase [Natronospira proteinivora]MCP1727277.1 pimeloyl-ACP methyl ester carboxylesterase [Natronospira proteinivora]
MQEAYFTREGTRLFYRHWEVGDHAPALVMCHGLASNGTRWREFAEAMAGSGWQILCPDLRGSGGSLYRGRINADIWADDLAALLDHQGISRAVVGGHCLGANLALRFAQRHPDRCRGLVLVEPMFPTALYGRLKRLARMRYILPLLAWPILGFNKLGIYRRNLPRLDLTELDHNTRQAMEALGGHEAIRKRYAKPSRDTLYLPAAAYLQSLNQVLRPMPPLHNIRQPALALLSSGALFGDLALTREKLNEMPHIRIKELSAMHWIPTEQPEAMVEHIRAWLETLARQDRD